MPLPTSNLPSHILETTCTHTHMQHTWPTCMPPHVHTKTHAHIQGCMHTHRHKHGHTDTHKRMHTHTHRHIHTTEEQVYQYAEVSTGIKVLADTDQAWSCKVGTQNSK